MSKDGLESIAALQQFLPLYKLCFFIPSFRKFAVGLRYLPGEPRMKHIMKKTYEMKKKRNLDTQRNEAAAPATTATAAIP